MADKDFVVRKGLVVSSSNLTIANTVGVSANGTLGLPGQVLTTNGSAVYWASGTGDVNTSSQFVWNNSQFYSANLVLNSTSDLIVNRGVSIVAQGSKGTPGQVLSSDGENVYWGVGGEYLLKPQNLADLPDKAAARTNLQLGDSATKNVGYAAGQVAPGDGVPKKDGTGATGNWNINAATAVNATNANRAASAGNADALQSRSVGTGPNQIVALDGNGALPAVSGKNLSGVGQVLVGFMDLSNITASAEFPNVFTDEYKFYKIILTGINQDNPQNQGSTLNLQLYVDGVLQTATQYQGICVEWNFRGSGSQGWQGTTASDRMNINYLGNYNISDSQLTSIINVIGARDTEQYTRFLSQISYKNSADDATCFSNGRWADNRKVSGFRVYSNYAPGYSVYNIKDGEIYVYGYN